MKTTKLILIILSMVLSTACGKIGVDTDIDDAVDTLTESIETTEEETEDTVTEDGHTITEEGIVVTDEPAAEREFLGTYSYKLFPDSCEYYPLNYDFPAIIRGFNHTNDDLIDFENNKQELVWVASVFQDETFDFTVKYSTSLGGSIDLSCTCDIESAYFYYLPETISCVCEDDDSNDCVVEYEKE